MLQWVKHQIVPILCVIGVIAPFVGMSLIDTFYYSTVFGWILGFCCFIVSYIIISKRPDDDEATSSPSATET